jgi:hypothetical protein
MLVKYGCGCVYLITKLEIYEIPEMEMGGQPGMRPTHGRLLDYCGGDQDDRGPSIGKEVKIDEMIRPENIVKAFTLTAEQADRRFDRLRKLLLDGHRYNDLKAQFKTLLGED